MTQDFVFFNQHVLHNMIFNNQAPFIDHMIYAHDS